MAVENKIKEIQQSIDKIKEHSDALSSGDRLSVLELSVIISKITKLHEAALILKYLAKVEHGVVIESCEEAEEHILLNDNVEEETAAPTIDESVLIHEAEKKENNTEALDRMMEGMRSEEKVPEDKEERIKTERELEEEQLEVPTLEKGNIDEISHEDKAKEENVEGEVVEEAPKEQLVEENTVEEEESLEPQMDFLDEVLEKEENPISIYDIEDKEELTSSPDLNEKFSDKEDSSLGGQLQKQPIVDLVSAIGLNERYLYSSELFGGEMADFKRSIQLLNDFETGEEAKAFFNNELKSSYGWDDDNELVLALYQLVERRYL